MKELCSIFLAIGITLIPAMIQTHSYDAVKAEESLVSVWNGEKDTSWYDEEENEFHIKTAEEFAGLGTLINVSNKTFEGCTIYLDSDLDMSNDKPLAPFYSFKGTFNGNYHSISNYTFSKNNRTNDHKYIYKGLVSSLEGNVCNLKLNVNNVLGTENEICGGICGVLNGGTIQNCSVSGNIINDNNGSGLLFTAYTGGICGKAISGKIIGCSSVASIRASIINSFSNLSYAGGICGSCEEQTIIQNSYFSGKIDNHTSYSGGIYTEANSISGGIVGIILDEPSISNVYSTGVFAEYEQKNSTVLTSTIKGGIIGKNEADFNGDKLYYLSSVITKGVGIGEDVGIAKSNDNMKKESFASSLGDDFAYQADSYPVLKWELNDEEIIATTTTTTAEPLITTAKFETTFSNTSTSLVTISPITTSTTPANTATESGDLNDDGKIDANDATLVLVNYSLLSTGEKIQLTESQQKAADVNGDGKIDSSDATTILQYYSYLSTGGDLAFKEYMKQNGK